MEQHWWHCSTPMGKNGIAMSLVGCEGQGARAKQQDACAHLPNRSVGAEGQ
jgi:hypothetical protein